MDSHRLHALTFIGCLLAFVGSVWLIFETGGSAGSIATFLSCSIALASIGSLDPPQHPGQ